VENTAEQFQSGTTQNNSGAELLDADEAIAYLGLGNKVSKWSWYEWTRRHDVPHVKIGRRLFYRRSSLDRWLTEQESASLVKPGKELFNTIRRLK